jgi:site-specific recombinase XerD
MGKGRSMLSGRLAEHEAGYRADLVGQGYKPRTVRVLVVLLRRLGTWMDCRGVDVEDLCSAVAEEFLAEVRADGGAFQPTGATLESLLGYLRGTGVVPPELPPGPATPTEETVEAFCCYLRVERGLASESVRTYARVATTFLSWFQDRGKGDLAELTAVEVVAFATEVCPTYSTGWAKMTMTGLRSFLGFAHVEGLVPRALAGAAPSAAGWTGTALPKALSPLEVRRLLGSCDRRRHKGRRDYAMLVLLVRLGLRAAEVAALALDDFDWRAGEVLIRGKGEHVERLPLPVDVGDAVAGYLRRGRPESLQRAVFLRVHAPIRGLRPSGVAAVVHDACVRAGVEPVGPHRLRHTAATEMLRAGASLPQVAQVLRHHSVSTTAIYAKVDHLALRPLALPWPMEVS